MALGDNWVICRNGQHAAELTLFCFPYAGGGASAFRRWKEYLPAEIEVAWVQLPGRENRIREQPFLSMNELVPALADGIIRAVDRPFAFYGHSLGAKTAFETARALRRRGFVQPCHLFVGASDAPQLTWAYPPIHDLPEPEFIEEVQRRYGGLPRQIIGDPELRSLFIPTLRADVQLMETYRHEPEPPLNCSITAFGGTSDHTVSRSMLEAWQHQTCRAFRLYIIPGDHFFLHSAQRQLIGAIASEARNTTDVRRG